MKKPIFTPEDFYPEGSNPNVQLLALARQFSNIANAKIEKLIESWPEVYGFEEEDGNRYFSTEPQCKSDTHSARLAFIEELPKEKCKHEPIIINGQNYRSSWVKGEDEFVSISRCKHCNIELIADWRAK